MAEADWPDSIDEENGLFYYYGDNRRPGFELHDRRSGRGGNQILRNVFEWAHGGESDRAKVPPFLIFSKGERGRDAVFRGLAVPGAQHLDAGSDLAAAATEAFRALRRRAVAAVPLRLERVTGLALSAAFLIERDLWKDFANAVEEQHEAHHLLRFDLTGPWAPYDFVRMQFGG